MSTRLFSKSQSRSGKPKVRRIRLEQLESRQLLTASLQLSVPDAIIEFASVAPQYGTVYRSGSTVADLTVSLTGSDNGSELSLPPATPPTVPPTYTVMIPAGSSSAKFLITPVPDATPDGTTSKVNLTASATDYKTATANVEVVDPLVKVSLPSSILEVATTTAYGYVSVNSGPVSVPTVVTLVGSDNGAELNLPPASPATSPPTYAVTIPVGTDSVRFPITPVVDATPDGAVAVTVTPSLAGYVGKAATVEVVDPQVTVSLPSSIVEAATTTAYGYVSVNTGPVSVPTVVTLVGSDNGAELNLPQASPPTTPPTYVVTIPAGSSKVRFTVTPVVDATPDGPVAVTVTPSLAGYFGKAATVEVVDPSLAVRIEPGTISEAAGAKPAQGVVSLNSPAPAGGLTVTLTSGDANELLLSAEKSSAAPAATLTVTFAAGQSCAPFVVTSVPDTTPDSPVVVTVTATATGYFDGSTNVTVVDQTMILKVQIEPGTISEAAGAQPAYGLVTLNVPAPVGGLTVTLTSSNANEALLSTEKSNAPAATLTVTIPAGQWYAGFLVTTVPDTTADSAVTVTVTATAIGAATGSASVNVVDTLPTSKLLVLPGQAVDAVLNSFSLPD